MNKNFPVIYGGQEYWVSRSIAVVVVFKVYDRDFNPHILAVQRGKGTPDPEFIGSWCLPCGYLDYNETTKEAAARELFEETGIEIDPKLFSLISINDDPNSDKRQNITFRYIHRSYNVPKEEWEKDFTTKFSEKEEVSNIKFIPIDEIDNYKWAFNHKNLINDTINIR